MSELYPFSVINPEDKVIGAVAYDIDAIHPGIISNVSTAVYALNQIAREKADGPDVTVVKVRDPTSGRMEMAGITFHQPDQLLTSKQLGDTPGMGPQSLRVLHEFASAATAQVVWTESGASE